MNNYLRALVLVLVLGAASLGIYKLFDLRAPNPNIVAAAASGPDQVGYNPYSWNGVGAYYYTQKFTPGTTTPCDITSPNATTTLAQDTADVLQGTTTATVTGLYRSSTPTATTTLLAQLSPGANGTPVLVSTSTSPQLVDKIIAPKSHLVFGVSGGIGVSNDIGVCHLKLDAVS